MAEALFKAMRETACRFEAVFFDWYGGEASRHRAVEGKRASLYQSQPWAKAADLLKNAPKADRANPDHPYFSDDDPQTMLIDEVEAIWAPIAAHDDWSLLREKIDAIHRMASAYGDTMIKPEAKIHG